MLLELKNSRQDMVGLVEKVMETKVVTSVEFSPLEGKLFSNFHFPIFLFPDKRGIILLAEELIIFENDLNSKLGSGASPSFSRKEGDMVLTLSANFPTTTFGRKKLWKMHSKS